MRTQGAGWPRSNSAQDLSARVLVFEREPSIRGRLIDLLERAGLQVRTAACARSARAALDERWPQIVIIGPGWRAPAGVASVCARSDTPALVLSRRVPLGPPLAEAVAELAKTVR